MLVDGCGSRNVVESVEMPRKWVLLVAAFIVETGVCVLLWAKYGLLRPGSLLTIPVMAVLCFFNGGYLFPQIHRRSR